MDIPQAGSHSPTHVSRDLTPTSSVFVNPSRLRLMMLEKGILDEYEEVVLSMFPKGEQRSA